MKGKSIFRCLVSFILILAVSCSFVAAPIVVHASGVSGGDAGAGEGVSGGDVSGGDADTGTDVSSGDAYNGVDVSDGDANNVSTYTNYGIATVADMPNLPTPSLVDKDALAPMNNLQILNNMEGATVTVTGYGSGVTHMDTIAADAEGDALADYVDSAIAQGDYYHWVDGMGNTGLEVSMYKSMRAGAGDTQYGGVSILFSESDTTAADYTTDHRAGWNEADLSFATTTMWLELEYTNVGYYKGQMINAIARILVIPFKNRNPEAVWDTDGGAEHYNYRGTYTPMMQISNCLYRGWVWQNVEKVQIDLQFYYSDDADKTPIFLGADSSESTDYSALNADYYIINSLNPTYDTGSQGETFPHYVGPEYILPNQNVDSAYIVGEYTENGVTYSSNIKTSYTTKIYGDNGDLVDYVQYAYNGGTTEWNASNDVIGADGFAQNSVMIMPAEADTLSFQMGHMFRDEYATNGAGGAKPRTSSMWATISTKPFTAERTPVNIDVDKEWAEASEADDIESVTFELWITDNATIDEKVQEIDVTKDENGEWKGTFHYVAGLETGQSYYIKETKITYSDGTTVDMNHCVTTPTGTVAGEGTMEVPATTLATGTLLPDGTYEINEYFSATNDLLLGNIIITKTETGSSGVALDGVTFELMKATVTDGVWTTDPSFLLQKVTAGGAGCSFEDLRPGNYILTEINTPEGYILLHEPMQITIPYTENGTNYYELNYQISNGQTFSMPMTGANGMDACVAVGMILLIMAIGCGLLYTYQKKRGQKTWR